MCHSFFFVLQLGFVFSSGAPLEKKKIKYLLRSIFVVIVKIADRTVKC